MKFLKSFFTTVLAIFFSAGVLFVVLLAISSLFSEQEVYVKNNSYLHIHIGGELKSYIPPSELNEVIGIPEKEISLHDIIFNLEKAALDDRIKGVVLKISPLGIGFSDILEVHQSIMRFRESGKEVLAYLEFATLREYALATAATHIYMPPESVLYLNQLKGSLTFFKDTFKKFGIKADFIHAGKYKSAPESFTRNSATKENKEQTLDLITEAQKIINQLILKHRDISEKELDLAYSKGMFPFLESAKDIHLIDDIRYWDDIQTELSGNHLKYNGILLPAYKKVSVPLLQDRSNKIAIIYADGTIMSGNDTSSPVYGTIFGANRVIKNLRNAVKDKKIKGIVLRLSSPGGSATASDVLWREILKAREVKPVYASVGNLAASGGYYTAMACNKIFVQKASIIGSIGAFMGKYDLSELYKKFEMNTEYIKQKSSHDIDMFSLNRSFTMAERKILQDNINIFYNRFVSKVAESRELNIRDVEAIAQGRVWLSSDERSSILYDHIGGLKETIDALIAELELEKNPKLKIYPEQEKLFESLENASTAVQSIKQVAQADISWINAFLKPEIWAMTPYSIEIK
mgnify:CR=1 FL=1